jgi:tRNA 2-selenouridine synthase SelU
MNSRDEFLKKFRGDALGKTDGQSSLEEYFQNTTLRPILKLQNDLILTAFKTYILQNKIPFEIYSTDKKNTAIENAILKDIKFQNLLKGFAIGLFTADEFTLYSDASSSINKRIRSMIIERLQSQLQLI